jgi:hypothetical protein
MNRRDFLKMLGAATLCAVVGAPVVDTEALAMREAEAYAIAEYDKWWAKVSA